MDKEDRERAELAEFKLGLITPVVNRMFPDPSQAEYFRRIASEPVELLNGNPVRLKESTMVSWLRRYREGGFGALMPKKRFGLGTSHRIDADLEADIQAMRLEHPGMSATMVHERLVTEGHVAAGELSVATVQRWFKRNAAPGAGPRAQGKDRRVFGAARVNGIWQAGTLYGPCVGDPPRRAYLQAIIDDKSRKIAAARFADRDNAATFQQTLRMAVASHGILEKLFVDNGGVYKNEQFSLICGGLGIALCHAAVRNGAAKGKIERLYRTMRMRFLPASPAATPRWRTLSATASPARSPTTPRCAWTTCSTTRRWA